MSQPFDEYLIELGARALCLAYEKTHSPDDLQRIFPPGWDMRKKTLAGDPYWMKYRADAKIIIDAIFDRPRYRIATDEEIAQSRIKLRNGIAIAKEQIDDIPLDARIVAARKQ